MLIRVVAMGCALSLAGCGHGFWKRAGTKKLVDCPEQTLAPEEVVALSRLGMTTVDANRLGDHHSTASLEEGMPMLKKAALHGDLEAMGRYASLVTWYGFIDNAGERFLGRGQWDNGLEGMLFSILAAHRGEPLSEDDAETFKILMDPTIPFPPGFFEDPSGIAWVVQGWPPDSLDQVRQQAYLWKDCWDK